MQSVMCLTTVACLTADPGVVGSISALSHTFVEIDHEIIFIFIPLSTHNISFTGPHSAVGNVITVACLTADPGVVGSIWALSNISFTGPHSAVGNVSDCNCVSDCRSRGCGFDLGPVPYFCRD